MPELDSDPLYDTASLQANLDPMYCLWHGRGPCPVPLEEPSTPPSPEPGPHVQNRGRCHRYRPGCEWLGRGLALAAKSVDLVLCGMILPSAFQTCQRRAFSSVLAVVQGAEALC